MTTIAFYQHKNDVEWGWDSLTSSNNDSGVLLLPKVFAKNGVVYGVAGDALAINVLLTRDMPTYDGTEPPVWLMKELRPALQELIRDEPILWDEEENHPQFNILVSVGGQGFWLDRTFAPYRTAEGIEAIGSGGDYAKGALAAGAPMLEAIFAAASIDPNTGGPLYASFSSKLVVAEENAKNFELVKTEIPKPEFHLVHGYAS